MIYKVVDKDKVVIFRSENKMEKEDVLSKIAEHFDTTSEQLQVFVLEGNMSNKEMAKEGEVI